MKDQFNSIKNVTVLGAGDMGHGIAEVAAIAGYRVHLLDVNQEALQRGVERIYASLDKLLAKGRITAELHEKIKQELLIPVVDTKEAVSQADLVIEAVPENMKIKKAVFQEVVKYLPSHTVLASNSSTMSISEIAEITDRPEKFLGLHFFNPVVVMKAVEVIRGDKTTDETMDLGEQFCLSLGKIPVLVQKDVPGFLSNRISAAGGAYMNALVDSGEVTPQQIDAVEMLAGKPMGPYVMLDYVGIDCSIGASSYLGEKLGPEYGTSKLVARLYEEGKLGKKTGQGIYDWSKGRPEVDLSQSTEKYSLKEKDYVSANEICKLVEDGICTFEDADKVMVYGFGYEKGYIELIQDTDPQEIVEKLERLYDTYKLNVFKPARLLKEGAYRKA